MKTIDTAPLFEYVDPSSIHPNLLCSQACGQPLVNPTSHSKCGKMFCTDCMVSRNWICPHCCSGGVNEFSHVNIQVIHNMLSDLKVRCTRCDKIGTRGQMASHVPRCLYPCRLGCGFQVSDTSRPQHEQLCDNVVVPCPAADIGCHEVVKRKELSKHFENCKWCMLRPTVVWIRQSMKEALTKEFVTAMLRSQTNFQAQYLLDQKEIKTKHDEEIAELRTKIEELEVKLKTGQSKRSTVELEEASENTRISPHKNVEDNTYSSIVANVQPEVVRRPLKKCRWDINSAHASVVFSDHDLTLQGSVPDRVTLGTKAITGSDIAYWEVVCITVRTHICVGVAVKGVKCTGSLCQVGYCFRSDGNILKKNTSIDHPYQFSFLEKGQVVGILADMNTRSLVLFVDGKPVAKLSGIPEKVYPAITIDKGKITARFDVPVPTTKVVAE